MLKCHFASFVQQTDRTTHYCPSRNWNVRLLDEVCQEMDENIIVFVRWHFSPLVHESLRWRADYTVYGGLLQRFGYVINNGSVINSPVIYQGYLYSVLELESPSLTCKHVIAKHLFY